MHIATALTSGTSRVRVRRWVAHIVEVCTVGITATPTTLMLVTTAAIGNGSTVVAKFGMDRVCRVVATVRWHGQVCRILRVIREVLLHVAL